MRRQSLGMPMGYVIQGRGMERAERNFGQQDVGQRARAALAASPIYVLRELHVEQSDGQLILTGRVDSYYHKQLAQEVVRAVASGLRVVNDVDVLDEFYSDVGEKPMTAAASSSHPVNRCYAVDRD